MNIDFVRSLRFPDVLRIVVITGVLLAGFAHQVNGLDKEKMPLPVELTAHQDHERLMAALHITSLPTYSNRIDRRRHCLAPAYVRPH